MAAIDKVTNVTPDGEVAVITLNSAPVSALSFNVRNVHFAAPNSCYGSEGSGFESLPVRSAEMLSDQH